MATLFERIGGTTKLKALADTFYDVMDNDPKTKPLRKLHPQKLSTTKKKLFRFLSHHFGGPSIHHFTETTVQRLNTFHLHQPLSNFFVEQWLYCMEKTLIHLEFDHHLREDIIQELALLIQGMQQLRKTHGR